MSIHLVAYNGGSAVCIPRHQGETRSYRTAQTGKLPFGQNSGQFEERS